MSKSGFAKEHLKSLIQRIERLEEEKAALTTDIREVYAEAKGQGFDTKIMRQVVRLRKLESAERQEADAIAMNMYPSRGLAVHGFEFKASRSDWKRELAAPQKAEEFASEKLCPKHCP